MADAERERDDDDFGDGDDAPSSSSSTPPLAPAFTHPAALGKTCALCGVDFSGGRRLMRCSGCRLAHYCSREHQAAHWAAHAEACNAERARVAAQLSESGLVLGADAVRENAERRAEDERAAAAATERARIEALDAATLRLELDRRGALAALAADASREALAAARLAAPAPTAATLAAAGEREQRALDLRQCRLCEAAMPAEPASVVGRCAACKRVRYCGTRCQRGDWPRHKPECKAWRDEAIVAAGGCPLGDVKAQQAAIDKCRAPERTLAEIREAAEGGEFAAQYLLGACLDHGVRGEPIDAAQAVAWYQRAAAGNVAAAQINLGLMHQRGEGGLAVDFAEAARLYASAAAQGHADAQYCLANCYSQGQGVPQDFAAALLWARRSADQGHKAGEFHLGVIYRNGRGVPVDLRAAASWFARSAAQGDKYSKMELRKLAVEGVREATAALYRLGEDAPLRAEDAAVVAAGRCPLGDIKTQNKKCDSWALRPLSAIREAAEHGDISAQFTLGFCLELGAKGSPRDPTQSLAWFRRSALGNVVGAQMRLANVHTHGFFGQAVDLDKAAAWLIPAVEQGDDGAKKELLELAQLGAPRAIAAVKRLGVLR